MFSQFCPIEKWLKNDHIACLCYCCRRRRFLSKSFQWKRKFLWLLWYYWVEWTWTSICGGMCVLKDLNLFYPSLCLTSIGKICNIFLPKVNLVHCFKISPIINFAIHSSCTTYINKIISKNNHFSIWRNFAIIYNYFSCTY